MPKTKNENLIKNLEEIVQRLDMDGALYELRQIAVRKRDEADQGTNGAEKRYWQAIVSLLCDTCEKAEAISAS